MTCMPENYNPLVIFACKFALEMSHLITTHTLQGHQGAVYDVHWSMAHQAWFSAGGDGIVAQWEEGQTDGTARLQMDGACYSVASWKGGIVAGNANGNVALWNPDRTVHLPQHPSPVFSLYERADGVLLVGDGAGTIRAWTLNGDKPTLAWTCQTPHGKVRHMAPHPNGTLVAWGAGGWSIVDDQGQNGMWHQAHEGSCYWALWHKEKQAVLSGGQDGHLSVQAAVDLSLSIPIHQSAVYRGVVHGGHLLTASRDKSVKMWRITDLEPAGRAERLHARSINAMVVGGANLDQLATAGDDRLLKLHHVDPNPNR